MNIDSTIFPTLVGTSSAGKIKKWTIRVNDNNGYSVIVVEHGYENGKMQIITKDIREGKNIGKKNETTPYEQAISEAKAAWLKKQDAGYKIRSGGDGSSSGSGSCSGSGSGYGGSGCIDCSGNHYDDDIIDIPGPMLAHDYNKRSKSIKFPCYVQRKYDGTRCIGIPGVGLYSRNKKKYPHMQHIMSELQKLPSNIILDGELYSDSLTFQEIVGLVKKQTLSDEDIIKQKQIYFHVYDLIYDASFQDRYSRLTALFSVNKFNNIKLVKTELCNCENNMKELHDKYVNEGYEGIMLRNMNGDYAVGQRSIHLQKYKQFFDDEYVVTGYNQGDGLEEGCVIWVCKTSSGSEFCCRPRGSREERIRQYNNGDSYIGKMLTVRYQELTDSGVPRFPVGIAFRDYE